MPQNWYDTFYENPFLPLAVPSRDYLLARGLWPDQIIAHQAACRDQIAERDEWLAGKPPGFRMRYLAEDFYYAEHGEPILANFAPDAVPAGITRRQHFRSVVATLRWLVMKIVQATSYRPVCAISGPEITYIIEEALEYSRPSPSAFKQTWRGNTAVILEEVELHVEPECRAPYLLPRGELWFMLAWRYDDPPVKQTKWARPVGVLRFEGYTDPEMVHIARCAR